MQFQTALLHSLPDLSKVEADHRIANNLASLSGIVRLQSAAIEKGTQPYSVRSVCAILQDISMRIEVTARLHKLLAGSADGKINLGKFIGDVCQALQTLAPPGQLDLHVHCKCPEVVEPGVALPIGLLIAELVTNSSKYAHPTGLPVKVHLDCETQSNGGFWLRFEDDGVGLPENFDPASDGGLGFRLMRAIADNLKATLTINHDELGLRCAFVKHSSQLAS